MIATNENDILDRFWKTGSYTKYPAGQIGGVRTTHSPAMDILVSSNFERLLWFLALNTYGQKLSTLQERRALASRLVSGWLNDLKSTGGFAVEPALLEAARAEFESERVSNEETIVMTRHAYITFHPSHSPVSQGTRGRTGGYILDPHSAVGVAASLRSIARLPSVHHVSLATAHPAKFSEAVNLALHGLDGYTFDEVLPAEFVGLEKKEKRVIDLPTGKGWQGFGQIVDEKTSKE